MVNLQSIRIECHILLMPNFTASACACSNIALIKYWGNLNDHLHIPANGSISMNLAGLEARTSVSFDRKLPRDHFSLNGKDATGETLARVHDFLDQVRILAGVNWHADVISTTNFPTGAGIASSAAGFAALSLAATHSLGLTLEEASLSRLARRGSGSACRSIPGGFVEWLPGMDDDSSYAISRLPADHWELEDCIAILQTAPKLVGSLEGHLRAASSPMQAARVVDTPRRLDICRRALRERDFTSLAEIVEQDSDLMHHVMETSNPPLVYRNPLSRVIMEAVKDWRSSGLEVCYTLDAGPNVHIICTRNVSDEVKQLLVSLSGVKQVLQAGVGGPARIL